MRLRPCDVCSCFDIVLELFFPFFSPLGLENILDHLWICDVSSNCVFAVVKTRSFCWALMATSSKGTVFFCKGLK